MDTMKIVDRVEAAGLVDDAQAFYDVLAKLEAAGVDRNTILDLESIVNKRVTDAQEQGFAAGAQMRKKK